jgi:hypothetical protein
VSPAHDPGENHPITGGFHQYRTIMSYQVKEDSAGVSQRGLRRFGRFQDLEHDFGIKRSTAYTLLKQGKIRGCSITLGAKSSRIRLIDFASVAEFIQKQMADAERKAANE